MDKNIIISGPCSAETRDQVLETAKQLAELGYTNFRAGVWKPRTKPGGFEGNGEIALTWLKEAKDLYGITPYVEVATPVHVSLCLQYGINHFWIGARTVTDPFATQEIADSLKNVDCEVLIKNPVSPDLELWMGAIMRFQKAGIINIGAIHRGFSVYKEKYYRNAPLWNIPVELKQRIPDIKIYCDPSHISGDKKLVFNVMQKAIDYGFDGFIVETHAHPEIAWTDSSQQITPKELDKYINDLVPRTNEIDVSTKNLLDSYRNTINILDKKIIFYLGERMRISECIGRTKSESKMPIVQIDRWSELISNNIELGKQEGLSPEFITSLWNVIHTESLNKQDNSNK